MKILTWNILASEWIKKKYYPTVNDQSLFNRDKRIQLILDKLRQESADILFLQEVMPMEYRLLYQEFHRTYRLSKLSPIRWGKNNESGNLTLVKKRLFETWKESSFDHGVYVCIDNIHLFNVHLDDTSSSKRKKQIEQLPLYEKYIILAGDFNQEYAKESDLYTNPGFIVHNKCPTYFVEKKMNLDNILTKGFTSAQDSCEYLPISVEEGLSIYGSDHLPVTVELY